VPPRNSHGQPPPHTHTPTHTHTHTHTPTHTSSINTASNAFTLHTHESSAKAQAAQQPWWHCWYGLKGLVQQVGCICSSSKAQPSLAQPIAGGEESCGAWR
jgi:hypothetical protein